MKTIKITIKRNDYDEFEVPTPGNSYPDSVYYTDDREDAIDTAKAHYAKHFEAEPIIRFRRVEDFDW